MLPEYPCRAVFTHGICHITFAVKPEVLQKKTLQASARNDLRSSAWYSDHQCPLTVPLLAIASITSSRKMLRDIWGKCSFSRCSHNSKTTLKQNTPYIFLVLHKIFLVAIQDLRFQWKNMPCQNQTSSLFVCLSHHSSVQLFGSPAYLQPLVGNVEAVEAVEDGHVRTAKNV